MDATTSDDAVLTTERPATPAERLKANLRAMMPHQAQLVRRLMAPVTGDHVATDAMGQLSYTRHGKRHRLTLPLPTRRAMVRTLLGGQPGDGATLPPILVGLGAGDVLAEALASAPDAHIVAWDRDPWLMRLTLSRHDLSDALSSGRLVLALGADIAKLARLEGLGDAHPMAVHPLLGQVYRRELLRLRGGFGLRPCLLADGGLLVDDVGSTLEAAGWAPYTLDLERLSTDELKYTVRTVRPRKLVTINYVHGLAEFCAGEGVELLCWEIDPSVDELQVAPDAAARAGTVLTYRAEHVAEFEKAGFPDVRYVPLAVDPERRQPPGDLAELRQSGDALAYVGTSMVEQATRCRARFCDLGVAWAREFGCPPLAEEVEEALNDCLDAQGELQDEYVLPELLEGRLGAFLSWCRRAHPGVEPVRLAGEVAASIKRLTWMATLGSQGVQVYGDEGWRLACSKTNGATYRGLVAHGAPLTRLYASTGINLDVGRAYQEDMVTLRVFEVLASGGFLLTKRNDALTELFTPGQHLATYDTFDELLAKIAHYRANPDEAAAIAAAGRAHVLAHHTVAKRLEPILGA